MKIERLFNGKKVRWNMTVDAKFFIENQPFKRIFKGNKVTLKIQLQYRSFH